MNQKKIEVRIKKRLLRTSGASAAMPALPLAGAAGQFRRFALRVVRVVEGAVSAASLFSRTFHSSTATAITISAATAMKSIV